MAGDWIKVEHATADKPEIGIAAEMLGLSLGDTFLLFVRYWVWLDQNLNEACPGTVPLVSRRSLESRFDCPGLSAVLQHIGWAKFDDEGQILTVTNSHYHNGKSAKARASEQKKKALQRARNVPSLPGPEKRREENIKPNTKAVVAPLPDWVPADAWKDFEQHRVSMKSRLTPRATELALKTLEKLKDGGGDPVALIHQSIERGWKSFFPMESKKVSAVTAWWSSEAATIAKGHEIGLKSRPGESLQDFRGRIAGAVREVA